MEKINKEQNEIITGGETGLQLLGLKQVREAEIGADAGYVKSINF